MAVARDTSAEPGTEALAVAAEAGTSQQNIVGAGYTNALRIKCKG